MKYMIFNNKGFSLLELVFSLALLSIIVIPIGCLFIGSAKATTTTNDKMTASYIAQREMETLKSLEELNEYDSIDKIQDEEYNDFFYEVNISAMKEYYSHMKYKDIYIDNILELNIDNLKSNEYYFLDIEEGGNYEFYNVSHSKSNGVLHINDDETITLLLNIIGEHRGKLKVSNEYPNLLNIYIKKEQDIEIENLLGSIRVYENYIDTYNKNESAARVYEVNIKVYKNDILLEELKGYKNIGQ